MSILQHFQIALPSTRCVTGLLLHTVQPQNLACENVLQIAGCNGHARGL